MTSKAWVSESFYMLEVLPCYSTVWEATGVQTQSPEEAARKMTHYRAQEDYRQDQFRIVKVTVTNEVVE
jgi:hypothetical protein